MAVQRESDLAQWTARYREWLTRGQTLLEGGRFGEAFKMGYPYVDSTVIPWADFRLRLDQTRLAVVTMAGFFVRDEQIPFAAGHPEGDATYRELPDDIEPDRVAIAHQHYEHNAALEDWNTVLPLDHLRSMVQEGVLRSLGPVFSVSGYCTDAAALVRESGQPIAARVRDEGCDAVLLVPV
ncbi:MAG: glycine/sarcosine/betaine reductase selenoprotein B family protein [Thermaerobacterales bacterium]